MVGENRTHPPLDLDGQVRRLGLEGRVRLSGFVSEAELADRYAAADVAVFLSEYEGFGLPALEAMARGVPVVTSTRPVARRDLRRGRAPRGAAATTAAVAAAVDRVLRDPALCARTWSSAAGPWPPATPGRRPRA